MNDEIFNKLSNMLGNTDNSDTSSNTTDFKNMFSNLASSLNSNNSNNNNNTNSNNDNNSNFDFSNIDMETIMKFKNIMGQLNTKKNDSRSNLLQSLKPYLKPSRQEKLDQYSKIISISSVLESLNIIGGDNKK